MRPKFGDEGARVRVFQAAVKNRLEGLELKDVPLTVDGDFGPETANALVAVFDAERTLRLGVGGVAAHDQVEEASLAASWLEVARGELGQKEIAGAKDNPRIVEYQQATTLKATDDETPWCASFVCWVLEQAGIESTRSARARSFESWGQNMPLELLAPGAIVVFWRGRSKAAGKGHVGFYVGGDPASGRIAVLGGNQGDSVSISTYKTDKVLSYRWPTGSLPPTAHGAQARATDAGQVVKEQWA